MRYFSTRETEWLQELDTIELASFRQRALAFALDFCLSGIVTVLLVSLTNGFHAGFAAIFHFSRSGDLEHHHEDHHFIKEFLTPILYWGVLTWRGKGQSPGKRILRIRVVSLVHRHLSLWHSIERALGYAAAFLEGGFGFVQFFIHPYRRCVQDRIAETIVVTERSYRAMQFKPEHALLPDDGHQPASRLADELPPPELPSPAPPPRPMPAQSQTSSISSST